MTELEISGNGSPNKLDPGSERPEPTDRGQQTAGSPAASTAERHGRMPAWLDEVIHRFAVIGIYVAMMAFFIAAESSKILRVAAFQSIFGSQVALVFLGLAAMATLVVGEFDLSISSVLGLSATIVAVLAVNQHMNAGLASVIAIAAAVACGLVNAFVVVVVGVEGFVVTLGSSTLLLGIGVLISNSVTVYGLSPQFAKIALTNFLGLPLSFYYGLALALVFAYIITFTPLGRRITFVGANREVARLAGVRVDRMRFLSYVASSTIAGVGGVLLAAGLGGFDVTSSGSYLLPALSAVFLGTAMFQPGRFNALGTWVGVYFLASGIFGLQLMGVGGWVQNVFYGAALVVTVAVSTVVRRRRGRG